MTQKLAWSVEEAAELIGISRRMIYELINSGHMRSIKVGRRRLIRHADLVNFIDSRGEAA